ncbi:MAG: hypothetical protein AAGG48_14615 [Planctomycetota bacterium]
MESTTQLGALVAGAAGLAWYYRGTIKNWIGKVIPSKKDSQETPSDLRVAAIGSLEYALENAELLGNKKAVRCIQSACQAFYECEGEDVEK